MKARELKKNLRAIPDDAEVFYKLYFAKCPECGATDSLEHIALAFVLSNNLYEIHIKKEYPGLPK